MSRSFSSTPGTSRVTISPSATINNLSKRTLMFWAKSTDAFGLIWSRVAPDGVHKSYGNLGVVSTIDSGPGTPAYSQSGTPGTSGQWTHFAFTYDDTGDRRIFLFRNGAVEQSYSVFNAAIGLLDDDSSKNLLIGSIENLPPIFTFSGLLYDFRLYNSVLTLADINAIFLGGHTIDPSPTSDMCHLTFATDQGGQTEPDASGNNNSGLVSDTATFNSDNPVFNTPDPSLPDIAPIANFDASLSHDNDGTIVQYDWTFSDGSVATGKQVQHKFAGPGVVTTTLVVTDNQGATGTLARSFNVVANKLPVLNFSISFSPSSIAPCTARIDASASYDPDGTIVDYQWKFLNTGDQYSGPVIEKVCPTGGLYAFTLTMTDDFGGSITYGAGFSVLAPLANQPPFAAFTINGL